MLKQVGEVGVPRAVALRGCKLGVAVSRRHLVLQYALYFHLFQLKKLVIVEDTPSALLREEDKISVHV